jgi:hypothetical protein
MVAMNVLARPKDLHHPMFAKKDTRVYEYKYTRAGYININILGIEVNGFKLQFF